MKKRIALLSLLVAAVTTLTACGDELNPNKYVTLGEYKGIAVTAAPKQEVKDTDIEAYMQSAVQAQTTFEEVTDRPVQVGDKTNIAYVGKKDGVEFEGGTSAEGGYDLEIGSGKFIPGFEEGLIGANKGQTLDINLTFPEDYGQADLAGQAVVFTVTVNSIKESIVPELTDELVPTLAPDCKTIDEYKIYVRGVLEEKAQAAYDQEVQMAVFDKIYVELKVSDPPQELIDSYIEKTMENADTYAYYYGLTREEFLTQQLQTTVEEFEAQAKVISTEAAKQELVIRAIGKKEKVKTTKDEINKFAEENLTYYGFDTAKDLIEGIGESEVEYYLINQKVMELLAKNAVVTEQVSEAATDQLPAAEPSTEAAAEETTAQPVTEANTEANTEAAATTEAAQ